MSKLRAAAYPGLGAVALVWVVTAGAGSALAAGCAAGGACTFAQPGQHEYVVPHGVSTVRIAAYGAEGGTQALSRSPGGLGGRTAALVAVRPGQRLLVMVGGKGAAGRWDPRDPMASKLSEGGRGGINGGAEGGYGLSGLPGGGGGGGASDVRLAAGPESRILVAGGGGGAGIGAGGAGGGVKGGRGVGVGGTGAAQRLGGSSGLMTMVLVGVPERQPQDGESCGTIGFAPPSASPAGPAYGVGPWLGGGGGGGGGWYGGGAGGTAVVVVDRCDRAYVVGLPGGPGGGGSGYADPALCSEVRTATGVRHGDGLVVITPA